MTPAVKRLLEEYDRSKKWIKIPAPDRLDKLVADIREEADAEAPKPAMPDYGEPCTIDSSGYVYNRNGHVSNGDEYTAWKRRAIGCVNALEGVRNPVAVKDFLERCRSFAESKTDWITRPETVAWLAKFDKEQTEK